MPLSIYNSQIRSKQEFQPLEPGRVRMYVCGVTVYDDPHIGHARCYVAFDAMVRHFMSKGWQVDYIRNFTDIDDKIINRAAEAGMSAGELADQFIASFSEDMASLGVLAPTLEPRATEHIQEMIEGITQLIDKGHAYEVEGGDVLFSVDSFPDYGKLSGRNLDDMQAGSRVKVDERKKNPMDFVLWKASKPGEPVWESPFGPGRPGWHIECSVMSAKYLGATFDIHGGGEDLVFPHHENELAQSVALTGQPFARYWVHNGFVRVNQEKMSKSLGNFFTIKDILKTVRPEALRLFLLSKHYRAPLDFSDQALVEASAALARLYIALWGADQAGIQDVAQDMGREDHRAAHAKISGPVDEFEAAMDDDFNTARALGSLFTLARRLNKLVSEKPTPERDALVGLAAARLRQLGRRLGILNLDPAEFLQGLHQDQSDGPDPDEIDRLVEERNQARANKDFAAADGIRDQLTEMGVLLEDTPQGTRWRMG